LAFQIETRVGISISVFARNGKRAEIELRPAIPENIRGKVEALKSWSQSLVMSMGNDLKHTDEWTCEICGMPFFNANV
jgi:hypothetical protein